MRHILLTTMLICAAPGSAQLFNGSFEQAGAPSIEGWEWACSDPGQPNTAAPGSGSWCVTKEPGHAKGCFPSYIFQRLPDLVDGQLVTVSGWLRCDDDVICLGAYIGIGTLDNGQVIYDDLVGTTDFTWTYMSITDTVELNGGDTAVVVLTSGFIGGPINPTPGYFDGISLEMNTGISVRQDADLRSYFDPATNSLLLSCGNTVLRAVRLHDLTGRTLLVSADRANGSSARLDLNGLPTGVYFASVSTDQGEQAIRFVVP
ncbi:MAG: T9SS type A sorting domain-containing protein [Flavobacteriales bacterium]|nr:T9SS type A sorting domain-containing protein [Flavobacteriales bacterium]